MSRSQSSKHGQRRNQEKSMSMKVSSLAVNMARSLCAVALLSSAFVWASVGGSIAGTGKDTSGRVIPNGEVTLREPTTAISYRTHSESEGLYTLPVLPVGHYELQVQAT